MKYSQNSQKQMWLVIEGDSDKEESDDKPPSIKQMLETFQILHRGIQQRGDFDIFELHKSSKDMIMKLAKEGKIKLTLK